MDAAYYHHERIHQSLGRIIEPMHKIDNSGEIACVERLGGLLKLTSSHLPKQFVT